MPKNLVCAIYNHPEAYPPTLNAIGELSKVYDHIIVLYQPNLIDQWQYPANVTLVKNGKKVISVKEQARLSIVKKILAFLSFAWTLLKLKIRYKPHTILVYDGIPLFAAYLAGIITRRPPIFWYHNHDVMGSDYKKYSVGWFAARYEGRAVKKLNMFSLPSDERRSYFDLNKFTGQYFCIPNYPSLAFYAKFHQAKSRDKGLKLIYQGSISKGHGIDEIINFLSGCKDDVTLTLIGNFNEDYKKEIIGLIAKLGVADKVNILEPVNYSLLPAITAAHDVGLAINTPHNIIYATGGTASNKIYEYAACGLPILYFDNEHYNKFLSQYPWAFATDLSVNSIEVRINSIILNLGDLSTIAWDDFSKNLNFETVFSPAVHYIKASLT